MHIAASISLVAAGLLLIASPVITVAVKASEASSTQEDQANVERFDPLPEEAQNWLFRVTAADIELGMSQEQVLAIIRWPGEEVSSAMIGESSTQVIKWENPDRSFLVCAFLDGKLSSKQQFMLP